MTIDILSMMLLSAWTCCATMFPSFYDPLPSDELIDVRFAVLVNYIAPADGPIVGPNKDVLPFFVPCRLNIAPLTAKMMERTGLMEGKQRSLAHVATAMFLVLDVDGLSQQQFDELLARLRADGLTFLVYSTHSHGRADKPGVRARVVIPFDRALNAEDYALAWFGFDAIYCNGAIAAADSSGKALSQQQGFYCTAPDRQAAAFRIVNKAGVASADALVAAGRKLQSQKPDPSSYRAAPLPASVQIDRLAAALSYMEAETTSIWTSCMMAFKALEPVIGHEAARELAVRYSEQGSDAAKAKNDDPRYDPATFFDNAAPAMPPEAAMGHLLALARDGALAVLNADRGRQELSESGHAAAVYLARFHRGLFAQLTEEAA